MQEINPVLILFKVHNTWVISSVHSIHRPPLTYPHTMRAMSETAVSPISSRPAAGFMTRQCTAASGARTLLRSARQVSATGGLLLVIILTGLVGILGLQGRPGG